MYNAIIILTVTETHIQLLKTQGRPPTIIFFKLIISKTLLQIVVHSLFILPFPLDSNIPITITPVMSLS